MATLEKIIDKIWAVQNESQKANQAVQQQQAKIVVSKKEHEKASAQTKKVTSGGGTDTRSTAQKVADAQTAYDLYMASEERKRSQQEQNRKRLQAAINNAFAAPGTSVSDMPLNIVSPKPEADAKEKELKTQLDYYKGQQQKEEDQKVLETKLTEYESWSAADKAALDQYIQERDQEQSNWFMADTSPSYNAVTAKLVQDKGLGEVRKMAEAVTRSRNAKIAEETDAAAQRLAEKHPVLGSGIAVGANLLGAMGGTVGAAKQFANKTGQFNTLDPNDVSNIASRFGGGVTQNVAQRIAGTEGNRLRQLAAMGYEGIMSAADSGARLAAAGFNPGAAAVVAASGGFSNALRQYSAQGASPEQAAAAALVTAGIEYATEKIPMDELVKVGQSKTIARDILKQAFITEPTTEEISLFSTAVAEAVILQDKSSRNQEIGELVAGGMSYEEAKNQADKGMLMEALKTYLVSAFSGGFSAGGAAIANTYIRNQTKENAAPVATDVAEQQVADQAAAPVTEAQPAQESMTQQQAVDEQAAKILVQMPKQEPVQKTPGQMMAQQAVNEVMGVENAKPETEARPQAEARTETTAEAAPVQNIPEVQNEITQESGIKGTGAAERGFTPKQALINEYGNIPEGENPVRADQLPQSTNGDDRVSYTARTAMEARVTPDEFVPLIEQETVRGGFSFIPIRNSDTVQAATQNIAREGWETARANWTAQIRAGVTSPEITATGAILYNHAVNAGDTQTALDILMDYQMSVRNTAQALQAARILKTLTPEDRMYMIRRSVEQMVQDMNLREPVTINEELAQRYQNAQTQEEADEILLEIAQDVARQIPPNLVESFTALRYLNMLGNLRTQGKNILGNLGSKIVYGVKDKFGAFIEVIADALSEDGIDRTKSLWTDRDTRRAAADDYATVQDMIMGNGRYEDNRESGQFARMVQENRRMLPVGLEEARRATNWAMEQGDTIFARDAYARALAGYLNARGIRTDDLGTVDPDILDRGREYAVRQAQEQTFRDNNQVSDFVSGILRGRNTPTWARIIGEGIMPFRRTPANVLVRAEEFSPLGLINSTVNTIRAANGQITGAELIDSWAKSLTGTALFILGAFLANNGVLSGGPYDDEKKDEFDKLVGKQDYAIRFTVDGKTYSYTIDWATPAAMPMFMGAQLQKALADKELTWADAEKVFTSVGDPLIQMSMLQGVNDTLENIRYAENNLGQFVLNSAMSYLTQGLTNTLLGQIERSTEKNRMTTYVDKESSTPQWLQRQLGKASQKIPGWDYQQMEYRNAFGQTEENEGGLLYNLISPGYLSKEQETALNNELLRLREATGENVFPQTPEKTITYTDSQGVKHKDHVLTQEQLEKMQTTQGQRAAKLLDQMITRSDYKKLTDAQKADAIKAVYEYAKEQGLKAAFGNDYHSNADAWIRSANGNDPQFFINRGAMSTTERAVDNVAASLKNGWKVTDADKKELAESYNSYAKLSSSAQQMVMEESNSATAKYLEIRSEGVSLDDYLDALKDLKKVDGNKDAQVREAIANANNSPDVTDKIMLAYMTDYDPNDEKPDQTELRYQYARQKLGMSAQNYAKAYKAYCNGNLKKERINSLIAAGFSKKDADTLYKLFKGNTDVVSWYNSK